MMQTHLTLIDKQYIIKKQIKISFNQNYVIKLVNPHVWIFPDPFKKAEWAAEEAARGAKLDFSARRLA
jgi:hypothetical protein